MSTGSEKGRGLAPRWRWLIWVVYVASWTMALLMPVPQTNWAVEGVEIDLRYLFAKSVHVSAYAVLAGLSGWLRLPYRYRWLLLFFVMAHGTVTELLQLLTSHRSGALEDVGFDHLGVAIGLLLTWRWWSEP
jgi:VanZ family protein